MTKIRNLNTAKEEVADTELLQLAVFPMDFLQECLKRRFTAGNFM